MPIRILLISDIHANYPALKAVADSFDIESFDFIINCGDSLVYAPFPNETLSWLKTNKVHSILGNTDKKVIKLLKGRSLKKPGKPEKRIMYTNTAQILAPKQKQYLLSFPKFYEFKTPNSTSDKPRKYIRLGIFHGSPAKHHEFLFANTPDTRFRQLAQQERYDIVVTGHSHSPYYKIIESTHFINPGSVGRMFDGSPAASCATLKLSSQGIAVQHFRIDYLFEEVVEKIRELKLPDIYSTMYQTGRKLN